MYVKVHMVVQNKYTQRYFATYTNISVFITICIKFFSIFVT